MARKWTLKHGLPGYDLIEIFQNAVLADNVISATSTKVVVGDATYKIVFKGNFVDTGGDPAPESGTVEKIKVFAGAALVGKAANYSLDVVDLGNAFDDFLTFGDFSTFMDLLFLSAGPRVVIDGSDDTEQLLFENGVAKFTLRGSGAGDVLQGGMNDDEIIGGGGADELSGASGNDVIKGNNGKDFLHGGEGEDVIKGGRGADALLGTEDDDKLFGGKGPDTFYFANTLGNLPGQAGVDTIFGFKHGIDTIALRGTIFPVIGAKLNKGEFHKGGQAQDSNDYILYNKGNLFHDADGDGPGGKVQFAHLDGKPNLSHNDFDMV